MVSEPPRWFTYAAAGIGESSRRSQTPDARSPLRSSPFNLQRIIATQSSNNADAQQRFCREKQRSQNPVQATSTTVPQRKEGARPSIPIVQSPVQATSTTVPQRKEGARPAIPIARSPILAKSITVPQRNYHPEDLEKFDLKKMEQFSDSATAALSLVPKCLQELTVGSSANLSDAVLKASEWSKEIAAEAFKRSEEIGAKASKCAEEIKVDDSKSTTRPSSDRMPEKKEQEESIVGDSSLDRFFLAHSDLFSLVHQIDELVVQALTSKKEIKEIKSFADFLSEVQVSMKPWISRFQKARSDTSTRPKNLVEQPLESKILLVPAVKNDMRNVVDSPEQCKWDYLFYSSPLADLAVQQAGSKGSKKGVQQTSKSQVAMFLALSMVLRRKPDVLINLLPTLRENPKYQGQDKLLVTVWVIVPAGQGDLYVGLYVWAHHILPLVGGKSGSNPQTRDLILQLAERILAAPKARSVLINGAVKKGERLVPPSALDLLLQVTFPASSARVKATERFEKIFFVHPQRGYPCWLSCEQSYEAKQLLKAFQSYLGKLLTFFVSGLCPKVLIVTNSGTIYMWIIWKQVLLP